jgi:hypothetical protein
MDRSVNTSNKRRENRHSFAGPPGNFGILFLSHRRLIAQLDIMRGLSVSCYTAWNRTLENIHWVVKTYADYAAPQTTPKTVVRSPL